MLGEIADGKTTRAEFLQQYYAQRTVPPQVTLDGEVEGKEALRQWLSEKAGRSVKLTVPQKGAETFAKARQRRLELGSVFADAVLALVQKTVFRRFVGFDFSNAAHGAQQLFFV